MRDIATATLSGNLTRDVELRELPSGAEVARLRVASTARRRNGEEWVDKTNYFTVEVYGAQARACSQYLSQGLPRRRRGGARLARVDRPAGRQARGGHLQGPPGAVRGQPREPPPATARRHRATARRRPPNPPWRSAPPRRRARARPAPTTSPSERPRTMGDHAHTTLLAWPYPGRERAPAPGARRARTPPRAAARR